MGRAATAVGTTDRRPGILDRSGTGDSPGARIDLRILPSGLLELARYCHGLRKGRGKRRPSKGRPPGPDVGLHAIWFQLSLPDRQRFGHCFSLMVLKALGLRSVPGQEDEIMTPQHAIPKSGREHLCRQAVVYVRQSSAHQVRGNRESSARQYALVEQAKGLGWSAKSVRDHRRRSRAFGHRCRPPPGLQETPGRDRRRPGRRRAGAGSLALARSSVDWHRLVEICVVTQTLLADESSGLRSARSQRQAPARGEGYDIRGRAFYACVAVCMRGAGTRPGAASWPLACRSATCVPTRGQVINDPDRQVQARLAYIFRLFARHKVAHQVLVRS